MQSGDDHDQKSMKAMTAWISFLGPKDLKAIRNISSQSEAVSSALEISKLSKTFSRIVTVTVCVQTTATMTLTTSITEASPQKWHQMGWHWKKRRKLITLEKKLLGFLVSWSSGPPGPPGPLVLLVLWSSGPVVLLVLWSSGPPGPLVLLVLCWSSWSSGPPGPVVLLVLWSSGPPGPLVLLVLWCSGPPGPLLLWFLWSLSTLLLFV